MHIDPFVIKNKIEIRYIEQVPMFILSFMLFKYHVIGSSQGPCKYRYFSLFIYVASFDIVLIQVALPLCSFSHAHYIE